MSAEGENGLTTKLEKPAYMPFLEAKGIFARGCFRFSKEPEVCYSVTRSFQLLGMNGEDAGLEENDLWERYEELEPVTKEEFEAARVRSLDKLHLSRGQPTEQMVEYIAHAFAEEYGLSWEQGRWQVVCRYDEETVRRIAFCAAALLAGERASPAMRQKKAEAIFRDVVLAKVQGHLERSSGSLGG